MNIITSYTFNHILESNDEYAIVFYSKEELVDFLEEAEYSNHILRYTSGNIIRESGIFFQNFPIAITHMNSNGFSGWVWGELSFFKNPINYYTIIQPEQIYFKFPNPYRRNEIVITEDYLL